MAENHMASTDAVKIKNIGNNCVAITCEVGSGASFLYYFNSY